MAVKLDVTTYVSKSSRSVVKNEHMIPALILTGIALTVYLFSRNKKAKKPREYPPMDADSKRILNDKVVFYSKLTPEEKTHFEQRVLHFLATTKVTGVQVEAEAADRLLVASGAIIPVFHFPKWEYFNLNEVLLYPGLFDENFNTEGRGRMISGMVGRGVMEGKMILSKRSLHLGFDNTTDKKNVAVHEFIHLIDKADGQIDGVPSLLVDREFALPWLELIRHKIKEIERKKSDINSYGATSIEEFFPVSAEYFFERPKLLKRKHPKLYAELEEIFVPDRSETSS